MLERFWGVLEVDCLERLCQGLVLKLVQVFLCLMVGLQWAYFCCWLAMFVDLGMGLWMGRW